MQYLQREWSIGLERQPSAEILQLVACSIASFFCEARNTREQPGNRLIKGSAFDWATLFSCVCFGLEVTKIYCLISFLNDY